MLHDVVLAPLVTLLLGALVLAAAAAPARAPAVVGFVVLGSVTLLAVPCSGGSARAPTTRRCSTAAYGPGCGWPRVLAAR